MSAFVHEVLYRGPAALPRLRAFPVTVCGAGALGANIAEGLARTGVTPLRLIDHDRVEERNLSTQPYQRADIGAHKAKVMAHSLYRAVGTEVAFRLDTLSTDNAAKLLAHSALVIDAFDNSAARAAVAAACKQQALPCLHAGLNGGYGEVLWDALYRLPTATGADLCDYPLARNLVLLTASVACEVAVRFALHGVQESYTITLTDLAVRPFGA